MCASQSSKEVRNEITMIATDVARLTAATTDARLTIAWPGAARNCARPSAYSTRRGSGKHDKTTTAVRGINAIVPSSNMVMET